MFKFFKKSDMPNTNAVNSIISEKTEIEGALTVSGTIKISGSVKGDIFPEAVKEGEKKANTVVIIEGRVHGGTIEADHVVITGVVTVNKVVAYNSLHVMVGGQLFCEEAFYGKLVSDESSTVNGKLEKITKEMAAHKGIEA